MWFARRCCFVAALILVAACFHTNAYSQQPASSLELQYRFGYLTEATHAPNIINQFGTTIGGSSQEHTVRLGYRHTIALLSDIFSIDGAIDAGYSIGSFTSDPFTYSSPGQQFSLQYRSALLEARLGLQCRLSDLSMGFSGWASLPITPSLRESLVTDGNDSAIAANGSILYSRIPAGIRLDIGYSKPLFGNLPITAGIFTEFDIDAFRQQNSFSESTSGGITLLWNFGNGPAPTIAESPAPTNPTPVPEPSLPTNELHAEVHFTEQGKAVNAGETISILGADTLIEQHTMLPEAIPLAAIAEAKFDHWARHSFSIDSLTRFTEQEIATELPNILGLRLQQAPDIFITLIAPDSLAIQPLVQFLIRNYMISKRQVLFRRGPAQLKLVEILPSDPALFTPVLTRWIERNYTMKEIGIERSIQPDSTVRNWSLAVEQLGTVWPLVTSRSVARDEISLQRIHPNTTAPVIAILHVTDTAGNTVIAYDTLHFSAHSTERSNASVTPRKTRYVLLPTDTTRMLLDGQLREIKSLDTDPTTTLDYYESNGIPAWFISLVENVGLLGNVFFHKEEANNLSPYLVITFLK